MSSLRKQPEGASRQAVGFLMGALVGFGISARQIFADFGAAGEIPWVDCVVGTMIGGVAGLVLATLLGAGKPDEPEAAPTIPPDVEGEARARFDPAREHELDPRVKTEESVEGVRPPDNPGQTG